ncbi:MAG: hypothetical protein GX442_11005 [Candidatus Riflebacteria bacterium]|nr:hypothetical protein [Candidatus Riflebacteria bacterium]
MARAKTVKKADTKPAEPVSKKKEPKEKSAQGAPRDYAQGETYEEGEMIYHKVWDDVGEILEVGTTEDGIRKMKVHFEKVGVKNLRMGQVG